MNEYARVWDKVSKVIRVLTKEQIAQRSNRYEELVSIKPEISIEPEVAQESVVEVIVENTEVPKKPKTVSKRKTKK
jgi:hypothetical protein